MAGTRLLIQSVAIIEIVLLTISGLWFGICHQNDVVCLPLKPKPFLAMFDKQQPPFEDLIPLFSPFPKSKRKRAKLILYLEDESIDWKKWSRSLTAWVDEVGIAKWPCWKHFTTDLRFNGPFRSSPSRTTNTTIINRKQINHLLPLSHQDDFIEIVFYVSKYKMFLGDSRPQEIAAIINNQHLLMLTTEGESIADTMSAIIPFLKVHGIDLESKDVWNHVAISTLYYAKELLESLRNQFNDMKTKVDITEEIAGRWLQQNQKLQMIDHTKTTELLTKLPDLDQIIEELHDLEKEEELLVPLNFPIEHFVATFAPLLIPLLLPVLIGLKREYTRFRQKTKEPSEKADIS